MSSPQPRETSQTKPKTYGFSKSTSIDPTTRAQIIEDLKIKENGLDGGKGRLNGLVGVITGVGPTDGIGTATARLFAKEGAHHIYLLDMKETPLLSLKTWLNENHPSTKVTTITGDCSSSTLIKSLINQMIEEENKLDFFFANAGIHHKTSSGDHSNPAKVMGELKEFLKPIEDIEEEEFMNVLRVNTLGAFLAIKYASKAMTITCPEKGKLIPSGSIILTSSVAGSKAKAGTIPYSASKSAINSLTQTCSYELMGKNIRVNSIAPGLIETDMTKGLFTLSKLGGSYDQMGAINPLQRQGLSSEVAQAALFLASDDSSYINGQTIPVDGGLLAALPYNKSEL